MSDTLALTIWTIAGALLTGLLLALLGTLKMAVARRPDRVGTSIGMLLFMLNVLLVPLLVGSGLVIDLWGLQPVMIAGPVLLTLSFMALGGGASYRRTQIAVVAAGLAGASITTVTVVLMPRAFFGEHEVVASLQLGMVFVALGALVSAPLIDILFHKLGFRKSMALLALISLLTIVPAALVPGKQLEMHPPADATTRLLEDSGLWLGCLVFFFYAPLEGFVGVWVSTHLATLGAPPRQASRLLFVFWMSMLLSRLLVALIRHSSGLGDTLSPWFLVVPALLAAVVLGNLAAVVRPERLGWGMFLLGLFLGPVYPFLVGLLFRTPGGQAMPGTGYSLLCASGSVGGLLLAPLVGYCARSRNLQVALLIPMFLALILTAAALLFSLRAGA
jgi:hypothetical protein